jgi:hypothetical protein
MVAKNRELVAEQDHMRREADRLAADSKRRSTNGRMSAEDVENAWSLLSPEGEAITAMRATITAGIRPALPWLRR